MQVTIDIPEQKYGELALEAETTCMTVQELVVRKLHLYGAHADRLGEYVRFPLIAASHPGSIDAVSEDVLDFLDPS